MLAFSEIQAFKQSLKNFWNQELEVCGTLSLGGLPKECENQAKEPAHDFEFALSELEAEGVIGTFHTHPATSANLSIADYWFFRQWSQMVHFVISEEEVRCYVVASGSVRMIDEEEDHTSWLSETALSGAD